MFFKNVKQKMFGKPVGVYVKWDPTGNVARLPFISYHPKVAFQPLDLDLACTNDNNTNFAAVFSGMAPSDYRARILKRNLQHVTPECVVHHKTPSSTITASLVQGKNAGYVKNSINNTKQSNFATIV